MRNRLCILLCLLIFPLVGQAKTSILTDFKPVCDSLSTLMYERTGVDQKLKLSQIKVVGSSLNFYFDGSLGDFPIREEDCTWLRRTIGKLLPSNYSNYSVGEIYCSSYNVNEKLEDLVVSPLGFGGSPMSTKYRKTAPHGGSPVVGDARPHFSKGLSDRNIAIWPSHGLYYNQVNEKWQWQRPLIFQTVEDLLSTGFVLTYLVPMLENAGAYVMLPRERDVNPVELIVDNDDGLSSRLRGKYSEKGSWTNAGTGFADDKEYYTKTDNPFTMGTARQASCTSASKGEATATWTPDIPRRNSYAVYVSYKTLDNSTTEAHYTVHHLGGETSFTVNQQMGGGTWMYLGTFEFAEGREGYVELSNVSSAGGVVSADAVKIGGGMGNIARSVLNDPLSPEETSGMPRYTEGARYWLQWAGIDPEIYAQHDMKDDYKDDLFARGDWVNYLCGGSSVNPKEEGKNIPIDLTMAFHTDAGTTANDSVIGTLVIYSRVSDKKLKYPDGEDRRTNRELADIVQSQIVGDMRASVDSAWQRRQIWNRAYRESRTPPTPTLLTESLSHQNFADMRYALDPSFRFKLSRAIYKGMLKYLSTRYGVSYAVQPLPVKNFAAVPQSGQTVRLSWTPQEDEIEPTAVAKEYMLYTRVDDGAFDDGVKLRVSQSSNGRVYADVSVEPGKIYSYKITALNDGGESFPSEVLAVGIPQGMSDFGGSKYVMVVNNFTRVSAPLWYDTPEYAGFDNNTDSGVPYIKDITFTGEIYRNRRKMEWDTDENPGFGASFNDHSGYPVAGNTFDYAYVHGKAIMQAALPFCSMSSGAFSQIYSDVSAGALDIICGKQVTTLSGGMGSATKYTIFPSEFQSAISSYTSNGGNVLISGAHIGTDIWDSVYPIKPDKQTRNSSIKFAEKTLGYRWSSNNASRSGGVKLIRKNEKAGTASQDNDRSRPKVSSSSSPVKPGRFHSTLISCRFNTELGSSIYKVDAADGLAPSGKNSNSIYRYSDSNMTAGVCYIAPDGHRVISFGFPLETLLSEDDLYEIISSTLDFFGM